LPILFTINLSHSQIDVSGATSSDTTWGTSANPYTVTGNVLLASGLPKTRSGKIMRIILRKIAYSEKENFGDIFSLLYPEIVNQILKDV